MKETQPNRYKRELKKWDVLIQSSIDDCKAKGESKYFIGNGLYPVFIEDICKLYEERGYETEVYWKHCYDQDDSGITFRWK